MTDFWKIQEALDGPHGDNATLYARTVALVEAADFPNPAQFAERVLLAALEKCKAQPIPFPANEIICELGGAYAGLYVHEGFTSLPPNPAQYGYHADNFALGQIRDKLLYIQYAALHPEETLASLQSVCVESFIALARLVPRYGEGDAESLRVCLIDVVPDIGRAIEALLEPFLAASVQKRGMFARLREKLNNNFLDVRTRTGKTRDVRPSELKATRQEVVAAYLKDTFFDGLFNEEIPFGIPDEQRFSGHWIIAPPGRGKTTLLHSMFLQDLRREASIIVMDSKGDLINPIKNMAAVADRLILIEPDAHNPPAINPLDVPSDSVPHAIALIEYILSGLLEAKFTNLQAALFRHVLPALMQAIPHPTIEDLKRVLADGLTPEQTSRLDARLRRFFEDKNAGFRSKTYTETRTQIIWRLDYLLANDAMRAMFASPTTRLKIADAMNSGKIILIDASKATLGDDGSEFYQRFFLAMILAAAQQRVALPTHKKLPTYCYLDECQWVRNDQKLATILDECRSQKVALILAHQRTEQITDKNVLSAMSNCAVRFANSDDEAKLLAPKLRCEPEFLHSLPRGTFAAFIRDLTPGAVALKVPQSNLEALPRMTHHQEAAIRHRMRTEYGFSAETPPAELPSAAIERVLPSDQVALNAVRVLPDSAPVARDDPETGPTW